MFALLNLKAITNFFYFSGKAELVLIPILGFATLT